MIEIGQVVVTKNSGVCEIISKEEMSFSVGKREYFILKPIFNEQNQTKIYIPVDQENLIRPIMKKEEVLNIIDEMPKMKKIWFSDQKIRKTEFEKIYRSGDIYKICQMVKSLYLHNEELKVAKHTLSMLDRDYLNKLREGIYQEFAIVLELPYEKVEAFIEKRIG